MMGRSSTDAANILIEATGIDISPEEFNDRVNKIKVEIFKRAQLLPGAEKLIRHLYRHEIPMAIATSSIRPFFEIKSYQHKALFSLFGDNITCGDDEELEEAKPSPQIYLLAKKRLGLPSVSNSECLVFEDAHNGVKSGFNAGMKVVWIPDYRFCTDSDIPADLHGAHKAIPSLLDFKPEEYGLPPYDN
ncbi:Pseudouridine-5'-phosphatase [Smittium mucronatum]|uniref:Pseudouridine-5'-phosphatase n=1 Tax=Smittium mucronatum TaxID=133383 RepID=A0A1R0GLR3_9FUNG|nr:Pseudouridine-5'-phosphatase [Smittium mucronatum]